MLAERAVFEPELGHHEDQGTQAGAASGAMCFLRGSAGSRCTERKDTVLGETKVVMSVR